VKKTATRVVPALVLALLVGALASAAVAAASRDAHARSREARHGAARSTAVHRASSEQRVAICHLTGSLKNPTVTITVDRSAVPAFMRQGDRLGACTAIVPTAQARPSTTTERDESNAGAQSNQSKGNDDNSSNSSNNSSNDDGRQGDSQDR
jgi:hypothetical protein